MRFFKQYRHHSLAYQQSHCKQLIHVEMNKSVSETGEIVQERIPIDDSQMGQSEVKISTPKSSRALALLSTGSTEYVLVLYRVATVSSFLPWNSPCLN